ncbi:TIGR02453 family protein [Granulicella rosea]|uniref:TIGR02453 family protein n=1 Tax=Granulicella rosea TaxID=474952 RepID=A0A239DPU6_9BACT|nr:DUF2461 domain-containing protein [Granulicella rosea]SNS33918.1 TIGR02453 family protein [Granulicella rosea]
MSVHLSKAALAFLKGLKKNNDRVWFDERKPVYEKELKAPMLALAEEINAGLAKFAPDYVRPPQKAVMRIYRDIRFSKNKQPYKTHVSAWWTRQGLEKTSGGGFYLEIGERGVMIAAGVYMPEKEQLLAIRRHLLDHHERLRKIMNAKKLREAMTPIDPVRMTRGPKGFPADHAAMDLILQRQWGVSATLPIEHALQPALVSDILTHMKLAYPMVALLNEPLAPKPKEPLF